MITRYQTLVRDFHRAMPMESGDYNAPGSINGDTLALRAKLIDEERSELVAAQAARDTVGFFGELCDVAVVLFGSYDVAGAVARDRFALLLDTARLRGWSGFNSTLERELALLNSQVATTVIFMNQCYRQGAPFHRFDLLDASLIMWAHTCCATGINIEPLYEAVMVSNLSKAPATFREDGKLLKGPNYKKHDLRALLIEQGAKLDD